MSSIVCPACKAYLGLGAVGAAVCPRCSAVLPVARGAATPEERAAEKEHSSDLVSGGLWLLGGTLITAITYLAAEAQGEGVYIIAWGPMLFGGIQFLRGLFGGSLRSQKVKEESCVACGFSPVEPNARRCPRCNARDPNPHIFSRYIGRGMLCGAIIGAIVGAVLGSDKGDAGQMIFTGMICTVPGAVVGFVAGFVAALAVRLFGKQ
ncbi:MAG: hypothetical protein C0467_02020 [Planctomycetaceae bacterium]|nr:hypothetical protein [Planctomycetaceae bacterium]